MRGLVRPQMGRRDLIKEAEERERNRENDLIDREGIKVLQQMGKTIR